MDNPTVDITVFSRRQFIQRDLDMYIPNGMAQVNRSALADAVNLLTAYDITTYNLVLWWNKVCDSPNDKQAVAEFQAELEMLMQIMVKSMTDQLEQENVLRERTVAAADQLPS